MIPPPPTSSLFPYTTLFRSIPRVIAQLALLRESALPLRCVADRFERPELRPGDVLLRDPLERERRSEEHTSELQSRRDLVCRLLLEKKKTSTSTTAGGPESV